MSRAAALASADPLADPARTLALAARAARAYRPARVALDPGLDPDANPEVRETAP